MAYETLIVEQRGPVDWVTLNRPEVMNALDNTLVDELNDYFEKLYWNRDTRVVVLRGAGKAFCAGLDLKAPTRNDRPRVTRGPSEGLDSQRHIAEIVMKMRRCPSRSSAWSTARPAAAALPWRWPATSASPVRARG
jgi:enoyl-CoA hydratase/carnithine racemase